jgi:signal transduction histidine kinase
LYVCSEALVNAEKHAGASRLTVDLSQDDRSVVLRVTDDGRGGADPAGSGLSGLADRLAVYGGRLRVESPPGAGTILTATLPRQAILR